MKFKPRRAPKETLTIHIVSFAFLYFVLFVLEWVGFNRILNRSDDPQGTLINFFWIYLILPLFVIAGIFIKNRKILLITSVEFDDGSNTVSIWSRPYYSNKMKNVILAYKDLFYEIEEIKNVKSNFEFISVGLFEKTTKVGGLNNEDYIWEIEKKLLNDLIAKLKATGNLKE